jgi:L-gulonolactone oxidase
MTSTLPQAETGVRVTNWASTHTAAPQAFYEPTSVAEIQAVVRLARDTNRRVRVVGSAHSPNDCAMSNDIMITLKKFNKLLAVDKASRTVQAQSGIALRELNEQLPAHGLALPNLGSISDQSVAGMMSTGTHGTGAQFGVLATAILEVQLVLSDGSLAVCDGKARNADLFHASLCGLGAVGVIVGVVLQCVEAFDLKAVQTSTTLDVVLNDLEDRIASVPYYRFWWFPHTNATSSGSSSSGSGPRGSVVEWRAQPVAPHVQRRSISEANSLAGQWSDFKEWFIGSIIGFHLLQAVLFVALYVPALVPLINRLWFAMVFEGRSERVDRSDRVFNFNCLFQQHVDEWAVPVEHLSDALLALQSMIASRGYRVHFPIEVRVVAGDDAWLSPAYKRATAFIGIIMYKPYGFEVDYKDYFQGFEEVSCDA